MPEVPNDGTHLTSETATVTDTTGSAPFFVQVAQVQTDPVEAELIGLPIEPTVAG